MKIARLAALLLIAAATGAGAIAQETQVSTPRKPRTVIEGPLHDFGEVKSGTPLKYSFVLKNGGDADLVINNVAPS